MAYSKAFFDLQIAFAQKVAELSQLPFSQTLLDYTNLYVRFGLGREFHREHPVWQTYLAGLERTGDPQYWTYQFYLTRSEALTAPPVIATFGCFSCALSSNNQIRLHFRNTETGGHSPLSLERIKQRREDLTRLFKHVEQSVNENANVVGVSWLYNLEAYRRLFPSSYTMSARVIEPRFQSMPLWGQFLNYHGEIKENLTRPFLECLEQQSRVDHLQECFVFQVLKAEASVTQFYKFYNL